MSRTGAAPRIGWSTFFTLADVRAILIGGGILLTAVGILVLITDIPPRQYPAIVAWLVLALLVHDVLIVGLVFAVAFAGRRVRRSRPAASIVIVQCALAVGAIVALVVVPQIVGKAVGTANPSVLPLDYAANLAVFLVALAVVTTAAVVLHSRLARRGRERRLSGTPD
ncbi:hypothetical protein [uncultured Microbacterium sp.]|uniref:hypothetical protein n=1 Tax=uncultured Microbacterium sp. TaxID=191216 RepID=UPI0028D3CBEA|nr:hypothetical protein [uncultured Microbacterium sp.]